MPLYVVTYTHPDAKGWAEHLPAHIGYLQDLLAAGTLRASGPFTGAPDRKALLILHAADRAGLGALVAADPFAEHGLIADLTVAEWNPIFGAFNADSSHPGQLQTR